MHFKMKFKEVVMVPLYYYLFKFRGRESGDGNGS